jgi:hypothetical protein
VSLVSFHRSLIVFAIAFCFIYAAWDVRAWLDGGSGAPLLGGVFGILGMGLAVYLVRLPSILRLKE